jgi:hypothetical protein
VTACRTRLEYFFEISLLTGRLMEQNSTASICSHSSDVFAIEHFGASVTLYTLIREVLFSNHCRGKVKVKLTLRLTVNQSVCLGVEPALGLVTRFFFLRVTVLFLWGALSDESSGLSFRSLLSVQSIVVSIYIICVRHSTVMYKIYRPRSVQSRYSRLCPSYK